MFDNYLTVYLLVCLYILLKYLHSASKLQFLNYKLQTEAVSLHKSQFIHKLVVVYLQILLTYQFYVLKECLYSYSSKLYITKCKKLTHIPIYTCIIPILALSY